MNTFGNTVEKLNPAFEHPASGGKSVIRRESLSVPVEVAHARSLVRGAAEQPQMQNIVLPEIADAATYYAGEYGNAAYNAGVDGLGYLRQHGPFYLGTAIGLWALGKIKRGAGWLKYKLGEFFSPYR